MYFIVKFEIFGYLINFSSSSLHGVFVLLAIYVLLNIILIHVMHLETLGLILVDQDLPQYVGLIQKHLQGRFVQNLMCLQLEGQIVHFLECFRANCQQFQIMDLAISSCIRVPLVSLSILGQLHGDHVRLKCDTSRSPSNSRAYFCYEYV